MAGDENWFIYRPQIDYHNVGALRPGMLIPVEDPASIIFIPRSDPPWEDARILLEEGDWP